VHSVVHANLVRLVLLPRIVAAEVVDFFYPTAKSRSIVGSIKRLYADVLQVNQVNDCP